MGTPEGWSTASKDRACDVCWICWGCDEAIEGVPKIWLPVGKGCACCVAHVEIEGIPEVRPAVEKGCA